MWSLVVSSTLTPDIYCYVRIASTAATDADADAAAAAAAATVSHRASPHSRDDPVDVLLSLSWIHGSLTRQMF